MKKLLIYFFQNKRREGCENMFYSLKGTLTHIENNFIVVECGGVGYKCLTSANTQRQISSEIGNQIKIYTHMNVRQDAIDLFAFFKTDELNCFKMLISVSGVGAKAALAVLSEFSAEQVALMISSGDSGSLTKASGIGQKTAQRIVLELKDKLKLTGIKSGAAPMLGVLSASKNILEAAEALTVLGYSQAEVMPQLSKLDSNLPVEQLIRSVLKSMSRRS